MSIDEIIKAFNEFAPFDEDDVNNNNETFLGKLMDEWDKNAEKEKAVPVIFNLMERYPHANFGWPGPLVHGLESKKAKSYEVELHKSLMRKPTPLTLWMYNRIINDENDLRIIRGHYERLKLFSKHPFIDSETKKDADLFLTHQLQRL
jgi:hypothetical protein